jgi:peptide/nickel transport system substrate-binding protein
MRSTPAIAALLLAAALVATPAAAKTLRFASAFDPQTMDPHALALLYHTRVVTQIYEGLVNRAEDFRLEPSLATSWESLDGARRWRFKLRPNVTFHDGAKFTADDAVFSIERALGPTSQRRFQMRGITGAKKVDDLTLDVLLDAPDAVLPDKLWLIAMMSRAWAVKHGVEKAQDYNGKQETFAVRNANGTGPYRLDRYEADKQTRLVAHLGWWGRRGNLTEVLYLVIQADATRLAALASGEVDFVVDAPFQDIARLKQDSKLKFTEITDIGTQYFTFDQFRDELQFSDVKGRNPFKDERVRRAVYHAVDVELIIQKVLRGQAKATGSYVSHLVDGHVAELDRRLPHDPALARKLLADAGYPNGFGVTLDCVNIKFREAVCQAAAAMLTQVGIRTTLQSSTSALFFPKLSKYDTSFIEYGWTPGTDPWATFQAIFRTSDGKGSGAFNAGRYSNPKVDALVDAIRVESDIAKRRRMIGDTLRLVHADLPFIPLYRRTLTWAMRPNIKVAQWPNDVLEMRFVSIE